MSMQTGKLVSVLSLLMAATLQAAAPQRQRELLGGSWLFHRSDEPLPGVERSKSIPSGWDSVKIPHTWAATDGLPNSANAWYRTELQVPRHAAGERTYLYFEGVATNLDLYVNGKPQGSHRGAYTAAIFDITESLNEKGANVLAMRVSNDPEETRDCLPSPKSGLLYRIYGGIYRKVWVLTTPAVHIFPEMASTGVFIRQDKVDAKQAELSIRTAVMAPDKKNLTLRHRLLDADGKSVAVFQGAVTTEPETPVSGLVKAVVPTPHRWSLRDPYLYKMETEILDGSVVLDTVSETIGLRSFTMDSQKNFLLNGEPIQLRGANKHQETEYNLNAVSDDELRQDWQLVRELGMNIVRLCHYPHARLEYDLADQNGILVWAENGHSNRNVLTETGRYITQEMVRQNFNHPSIVLWSCGNETYEEETATAYANVIRQEDPSRLVTYGSNGTKPRKLDFMASNVYHYWYGKGEYQGGDDQLNSKMRYFSEYGAGGLITTHCAYGEEKHLVNRYEPEEYQQLMLERVMPTLFGKAAENTPFFTWWCFKDFSDIKYKGRNTKGLLTYNNFRKDVYYLYQSYLKPDAPVLQICGKTHFVRSGASLRGIKVYGNAASATLSLNGHDMGRQANGAYHHKGGTPVVNNVFFWDVPLQAGRNEVVVTDDKGRTDRVALYGAPADEAVPQTAGGLICNLSTDNHANPAYLMTEAPRSQEPLYYQCDGNADNTLDQIPAALADTQRIATRRLSDPDNATEIRFQIAESAGAVKVYILATAPSSSTLPAVHHELSAAHEAMNQTLKAQGFTDAGIAGLWRDNRLNLVGFQTLVRSAKAGEKLTIPAFCHDYLVLIAKDAK